MIDVSPTSFCSAQQVFLNDAESHRLIELPSLKQLKLGPLEGSIFATRTPLCSIRHREVMRASLSPSSVSASSTKEASITRVCLLSHRYIPTIHNKARVVFLLALEVHLTACWELNTTSHSLGNSWQYQTRYWNTRNKCMNGLSTILVIFQVSFTSAF